MSGKYSTMQFMLNSGYCHLLMCCHFGYPIHTVAAAPCNDATTLENMAHYLLPPPLFPGPHQPALYL